MYNKLAGFNTQQQNGIDVAFKYFLQASSPMRVIDLGTGYGGLSVFIISPKLSGYRCSNFITIDYKVYDQKALDIITGLGGECIVGDIFSAEIHGRIEQEIIKDGTTLLLCDNGDKIREFNDFAPLLKPGDYIMAHDYYSDQESFMDEFVGEGCCEITYQDIESVCTENNIIQIASNVFKNLLWFAGYRKK